MRKDLFCTLAGQNHANTAVVSINKDGNMLTKYFHYMINISNYHNSNASTFSEKTAKSRIMIITTV